MTVAEVERLVSEQIPLVKTLRIQLEEVSPSSARLLLRFDAALGNHTGSLHAGALFTAAETCALSLGYMLLPSTEVLCQTKAVEMRFRKPARADVWATAQPLASSDGNADSDSGQHEELLRRLTAEGKIDVPLLVAVADQAGERAAEGTITLTLRRL
jgi:uncharacterized protein (TIGR00369 family)